MCGYPTSSRKSAKLEIIIQARKLCIMENKLTPNHPISIIIIMCNYWPVYNTKTS